MKPVITFITYFIVFGIQVMDPEFLSSGMYPFLYRGWIDIKAVS